MALRGSDLRPQTFHSTAEQPLHIAWTQSTFSTIAENTNSHLTAQNGETASFVSTIRR